ncbi:MAG TPA: YlxR family protein [Bacillota bacterium]|nr:YlxR family protein [Bacillota bacterium]
MRKRRKVPQRKCVVTREMKPKQEMIRIVRNKEGEVFVDPTGKKNGRGAYLTMDLSVIQQAEETNALSTHLQTEVDPHIYEELKQLVTEQRHEK